MEAEEDNPEKSASIPSAKPSPITRSFSLTEIFTPRLKRTASSSLPRESSENQLSQSLSVLVVINNQRRMTDSFFRAIPSTPCVQEIQLISFESPSADPESNGGGKEEIAEKKAVCRICLIELSEDGGETLKMECGCKGELCLAHQDCAVKWFSLKGNQICEVCNQQMKNLPEMIQTEPDRIPQDDDSSAHRQGPEFNLEFFPGSDTC